MPYYLVSFTLSQKYFDEEPEIRDALTKQEIDHGIRLFKVGIWKHSYTTPGKVKTHSWALYKANNEAELERYLTEYPMDRRDMYTRITHEVSIPDPPWIVGLLYNVLRLMGLYKPWRPS